jgi:hypothetical protein
MFFLLVQCQSIVYEHTSTICTRSHVSCSYSRLQLADEETGGEEAHALGQDVLGEDVDERRQQDEGHGGLVDEEEGDQLGHGRLEDHLAHALTCCVLHYSQPTHHLLRGGLGLLGLAGSKGRAGHGRWADSRGRAESGPGEGTEEAGVHGGLSGGGSARCGEGQFARGSWRGRRRTHRTGFAAPVEMVRDGVAGRCEAPCRW